ncbi:MAG: hypothetical protein IKI32_04365, partial [Lachnospiraceae bacterium]|nr:hypothetical protein [Lachnospiraceae bacterium]
MDPRVKLVLFAWSFIDHLALLPVCLERGFFMSVDLQTSIANRRKENEKETGKMDRITTSHQYDPDFR